MKKILGLIGSPRKLGNCEIMIKAVGRELGSGCELRLLRLSDFRLQPCIGCYRCLFKERRCVLKDELGRVIEAMIEADGIVLAAPAYFLGANAQLKTLVDRGLAFYAHGRRLWGKPIAGIGIAGIPGTEGATLLEVHRFQKLMLADVKATVMLYGALPGETFLSEENKAMARRLAAALFGEPLTAAGPRCPLCGGDTFRLLGGNRVRCMLCSNSGTMSLDGGEPVLEIAKSRHELFLNADEAMNHMQWLMDMKERYRENKAALKTIGKEFAHDGTWIRPNA